MESRYSRVLGCALAAMMAGLAMPAQADEAGALGMIDPALVTEATPTSLGVIAPRNTWRNASVASAGVGLRNRGEGAIVLGDVRGPVRRAFLYWTVNYNGSSPPAGAESITVQRLGPDRSRQVTVTGQEIGAGEGPCWGPARISVFRAVVPVRIVSGNGTYIVRLPEGLPGRTDGGDPWDGNVREPLYNGASLVAIGAGNETVALYEGELSGRTQRGGTLAYTLRLPPAIANGAGFVRFHQIGSDGQEGAGRGRVTLEAADVVVRVNGTSISGAGSAVGDSDWNGAAGGPIAQLWDNRLREVSGRLPSGDRRMNVEIVSAGDCITPVANIVAR